MNHRTWDPHQGVRLSYRSPSTRDGPALGPFARKPRRLWAPRSPKVLRLGLHLVTSGSPSRRLYLPYLPVIMKPPPVPCYLRFLLFVSSTSSSSSSPSCSPLGHDLRPPDGLIGIWDRSHNLPLSDHEFTAISFAAFFEKYVSIVCLLVSSRSTGSLNGLYAADFLTSCP